MKKLFLFFLCLMPVCMVEGGKKKIIGKKEQTEEPDISLLLSIAVEQNDKYKVSQLMKKGAKPDKQWKYGGCSLDYAVVNGRHKCFKKMLAKCSSADHNKLLTWAITCHKHRIVKHLFNLHRKHKIFLPSKLVSYFGQTVDDRQWKIALQLLAQIGEDQNLGRINYKGDTFLHTCVDTDNMGNFNKRKDRLVKQLCERKDIDINAKNEEGKTALNIALERLDERVAKILLDAGANTDECRGETLWRFGIDTFKAPQRPQTSCSCELL